MKNFLRGCPCTRGVHVAATWQDFSKVLATVFRDVLLLASSCPARFSMNFACLGQRDVNGHPRRHEKTSNAESSKTLFSYSESSSSSVRPLDNLGVKVYWA